MPKFAQNLFALAIAVVIAGTSLSAVVTVPVDDVAHVAAIAATERA
ncbi:hypothetical protein AAG612_15430 [Citromicrobium bathyomarinum]